MIGFGSGDCVLNTTFSQFCSIFLFLSIFVACVSESAPQSSKSVLETSPESKSTTQSSDRILKLTAAASHFCQNFEHANHCFNCQETQDLVEVARKNITKAKLPNGKNVPAETDEDLKQPIITNEVAACAASVGRTSALAKICGIDYEKRLFSPFMNMIRKELTPSDKQVAFIGLLHGISAGKTLAVLTKGGAEKCPQDAHDRLDKMLPK